jgi:hypothetical protein
LAQIEAPWSEPGRAASSAPGWGPRGVGVTQFQKVAENDKV